MEVHLFNLHHEVSILSVLGMSGTPNSERLRKMAGKTKVPTGTQE